MIFHALALIGIWGTALKVMKELETLESLVVTPAAAVIPSNVDVQPQQAPVTLPQPVEKTPSSKTGLKIVLGCLAFLVIAAIIIVIIVMNS